MLGVAAPVLHRYVAPPVAVSVTAPPAQNVLGPSAEIPAVGAGLMSSVVVAEDAAQPPPAAMVVSDGVGARCEPPRRNTPVLGVNAKPLGVALKVPALAPVPSVGVTLPVLPAQRGPVG